MKWERVELLAHGGDGGGGGGGGGVETCGPGKRWGHTCNAIKGGRFVYVFGGYGRDNCQTNQVHVFDTVKQTWSEPIIKGMPPIPRDSHTCTSVCDNLFVFGGTDGKSPLKDLHILDTSSHTWISPTMRGDAPQAREGHSAALVGKKLFIFGGCGRSADYNEEVYYNDLHVLNTETFVWEKAVTTGIPPSPRDSHTCSSWKNKLIVIGGEDGHDYYLSDVHVLDAETLMWKELKMTGHALPPRAGHATISFGKLLFVYGGFTEAQKLYDDLYMLDVDSALWTKVATSGEGPSARFSVAGESLDPVRSGVLLFIGGCNKGLEALEDMYYLYTGLKREQELRPEKLSLRKQLKLKCLEQSQTNDRALVQVGPGTNAFQPLPFPHFGQPGRHSFSSRLPDPFLGKKVFQARVTESLNDGYTIETVIDGKPLRGILFSNNPRSIHVPIQVSSRKRTYGDVGVVMSNGDHNRAKSARSINEDSVEKKEGDNSQGKEPELPEKQPEVTSASPSLQRTDPSDTPDLEKVSTNLEMSLGGSQIPVEEQIDAKKMDVEFPGGTLPEISLGGSQIPADEHVEAKKSNVEFPKESVSEPPKIPELFEMKDVKMLDEDEKDTPAPSA
ncbi:hypothetical protein MLD38_031876 [Melastoma candidum]|uniref:Uncharacterized protein n=1 Tax=Melastoma candidum TaxID=119954 RepID=A0ACB9MS65_9MYRT|nr:hypothetical protein MLD38_031876 [Melastoma candidum]